eukprot:g13740.t1
MGPRGNFPRGFMRTLSSAGLGVEVGVDLGADLDHIGCRRGTHISTHIGASISDGPASDKSYQHGATQPPLVKESPEPRLEPSTSHNPLGCWTDNAARTMLHQVVIGADSIERCARYCGHAMNVPGSTQYTGGTNATYEYIYFGVQNQGGCFCSNQLARVKILKASTACQVCNKNAEDKAKGLHCGGPWANSVYETRNDKYARAWLWLQL